jgi:hypothetical protein
MDAVRKAVIQIIGSEAEARQRDVLQDVLYGTSNPNQYVFSDSMETLRRENLGTIDEMDMIYEIRIKVNIDRVRETLDRNGIGRDSDAGRGSSRRRPECRRRGSGRCRTPERRYQRA